jgi:hypothetical protein
LSEEFEQQTAAQVKQVIDTLSTLPPEATAQINVMLQKQGLDTR